MARTQDSRRPMPGPSAQTGWANQGPANESEAHSRAFWSPPSLSLGGCHRKSRCAGLEDVQELRRVENLKSVFEMNEPTHLFILHVRKMIRVLSVQERQKDVCVLCVTER